MNNERTPEERGFVHDGAAEGPAGKPARPAKIRLLYESADGRLCLFEDELGHLTAVRAAKLA